METMILMTAFLLEKWKNTEKNGNQFVGSTIVSTYDDGTRDELRRRMQSWLTGFKWIAKMIKDFPEQDSLVVVKKVLIYGRRCST
jgi:hypothetical protein